MVRRAWLVIAALAAIARVAHGDAEIVELRYAAPAGCPARPVVEAAILERTPNVSLAASARRVFAITIVPIPDGFRGTLVVDEVADKELSAQRCDDLATALALVTALAIDPSATLAPRPAPSAWTFEADLGGLVEAGVSPGMMLAGELEARATRHHRYQLELAAIAGRDSSTHDDAQARFTWLAARPAACLVSDGRGVTFAGCGHVELGAVQARGEMIVNQRGLTRLWLAAGAHASAHYPLGPRMFAHLQLGASLPLVRDRYLFAPNVSIHETPGVTGWLVVGVGVRFL
jgi:hypothetical protein